MRQRLIRSPANAANAPCHVAGYAGQLGSYARVGRLTPSPLDSPDLHREWGSRGPGGQLLPSLAAECKAIITDVMGRRTNGASISPQRRPARRRINPPGGCSFGGWVDHALMQRALSATDGIPS